MKSTIKATVAALAVSCAVNAFAAEEIIGFASDRDEVVGWTPICIGIATPVQLPFGMNKWDVFGIDFNLLYSDAPKMYGIDVGGLAAVTRNEMMGLQVAALANYAVEDVYGARIALGVNIANANVYGLEASGFALRPDFVGLDIEFVGAYQRNFCGLGVSGLANIATEKLSGVAIAGGCNIAKVAYGLHIAALYNHAIELHGCQIGLVNYCSECVCGFQIGLVNFIMSNQVKVLPFVNGYF